jgi:lipopolysaccharide biosynthesis glycosyltransferase
MKGNNDRAICLMVIGRKYEKRLDKQREQIEEYAIKCNATVEIIKSPPDPSFKRPLLAQKLLIAQLLIKYKLVLFLDLDIIISKEAPSVFESLPSNKSFGAVLDPRGTPEFKKTWKHLPHGEAETTAIYFTNRNFSNHPELKGSINGGVFLFRPNEVAEDFKAYYLSDHNQGEKNSYEEAPMAYITQTKKQFYSLDPRYNVQLLYKLKGTLQGEKLINKENWIPKFVKRKLYKWLDLSFIPVSGYKDFCNYYLEQSYFLHFSSGLPLKLNR